MRKLPLKQQIVAATLVAVATSCARALTSRYNDDDLSSSSSPVACPLGGTTVAVEDWPVGQVTELATGTLACGPGTPNSQTDATSKVSTRRNKRQLSIGKCVGASSDARNPRGMAAYVAAVLADHSVVYDEESVARLFTALIHYVHDELGIHLLSDPRLDIVMRRVFDELAIPEVTLQLSDDANGKLAALQGIELDDVLAARPTVRFADTPPAAFTAATSSLNGNSFVADVCDDVNVSRTEARGLDTNEHRSRGFRLQ